MLGGNDFNRIAAAQNILQRYQLAVDARAGTVVPDFRVDPVGEVDDRRAFGEVQKIPFGSKHVHRGREQIFL